MDTNTEQLSIIADGWQHKDTPTFEELSASILQTHQSAQASAIKAVNQMATLRNWLIGCYIVEYEQKGSDRAKYGDRLLKRLEERVNTKGLNLTLFKNSRRFFLLYPQLGILFGKSPMPSDFLDPKKDYNKKSPTASGRIGCGELPSCCRGSLWRTTMFPHCNTVRLLRWRKGQPSVSSLLFHNRCCFFFDC